MSRDYRLLWSGNAASNLSDGLIYIGLPLVVAGLGGDAAAVAGLTVAYTVPRLVAVLGIGVLVDRVDRRRLLVVANAARCAIFGTAAVLLAMGPVPVAVLYVMYGLVGLIEATSDTAVVAMLPAVVRHGGRPGGLDRANAQVAGTQLVVDEFVGPPVGGLLFAVAVFAPVAVSAVACAVAAGCFAGLSRARGEPPAGVARGSARADLVEAVRWVAGQRVVGTLVLVGAVASVGYALPFSYLVVFAEQVLGLGSTGFGVLMAVTALGGLVGSAAAPRLRRRFGYGATIVAALVLGAVSMLVCAVSSGLVVVTLALSAYICHAVVWNVLSGTVRQRLVPGQMLGRVGAVGRLAGYLGIAAGAALGGWLAGAAGLHVPFAVSAGLFGVCVVLAATMLPALRRWEGAESPEAAAVEVAR